MNEQQQTLTLTAQERTATGRQLRVLRKEGQLPAVLYGSTIDNKNLTIPYKMFEQVYKQGGRSSLIDLKVGDNQEYKVLIQEIQQNPVTDEFIHADFHQVKMDEKLHAEAAVKYVGQSKAVKEQGGVLVKNFNTIKIECLPKDLINEVTIDISSLRTFDDLIRIKDVNVPSGVILLDDAESVVVKVQPPRSDAELKALEEKPEESVSEVEKVGGEKEEEAESEGADKDIATDTAAAKDGIVASNTEAKEKND